MDTGDCADKSVVATVRTIEGRGRAQYDKFVQDVIKELTVSIHSPIKKNAFPLFQRQGSRSTRKAAKKFSVLKSDCTLFSRLYIANQHRNGDLHEFLKYENLPFPPSLSEYWKMRFCKKSDLLVCLEPLGPSLDPPTTHDVKFFDGAALVRALTLATSATFSKYAEKVFIPFVVSQLQSCDRVDIVGDSDRADSLKEATREKRGKGKTKKVADNTKLPRHWTNFLKDPSNKLLLLLFYRRR